MLRFGVDLGGSKIELVALDNEGSEQFRQRVVTPKTYQDTVNAIVGLVALAESTLNVIGSVGLGIPGVISGVTGRVKNANSTWLNGHPLDRDLAIKLAREIRVANDANCFALSEAIDGAGAGQGVVFGVIIGTGCGGGITINGRIHKGINAIAGEWGHNPLPWMTAAEFHSTSCFCGRRDCIETFISGTGFVRDYNLALSLMGESSNLDPLTRAEEVMARVNRGDPIAIAAFSRYIERLARALAHMINILDPDVIVLGGGMSNIDAIYPALTQVLATYVLGGECRTPVVKNKYGCSSGVRGAAWLW